MDRFVSIGQEQKQERGQAWPVEFHCHGIGEFDFCEIESLDLLKINEYARLEEVFFVPTIFLAKSKLDVFVEFMHDYAELRRQGKLPYIVGIGLEGPLLASFGGTPERGTWLPTKAEWMKIADCGELGLEYLVFSPDALMPGSFLEPHMSRKHPGIGWVTATLVEGGVRPALGHFQKSDPAATADSIRKVLDIAKLCTSRPLHEVVLTDHLFNDTPLKFRHAWRLPAERENRASELEAARVDEWTLDNLDELVGEVPGILMRAAAEGELTICMNFDGEHVDLEICKRVVELVGANRVIAMTDRTDINSLGGQELELKDGCTLWYQEKGLVAAGTSTVLRQMNNILSLGFSEAQMWEMVSDLPLRVLARSDERVQLEVS